MSAPSGFQTARLLVLCPERTVLARAVAAQLDDRVLLVGNKTVVF